MAYLVTAFIQKPPPIFASAMLRQTSDIHERYTQFKKYFSLD